MDAQQVMAEARQLHVHELKAQIAALKAENSSLRAENESLKNHLDLAMLAASDFAALPAGGKLVILDGWNLVLAKEKEAGTPDELIAQARTYRKAHPNDFVWIVFDGPVRNSFVDRGVRISYTGGEGLHRADKLICDFLRMTKFRGDASRVVVRTYDRDFQKTVEKILG